MLLSGYINLLSHFQSPFCNPFCSTADRTGLSSKFFFERGGIVARASCNSNGDDYNDIDMGYEEEPPEPEIEEGAEEEVDNNNEEIPDTFEPESEAKENEESAQRLRKTSKYRKVLPQLIPCSDWRLEVMPNLPEKNPVTVTLL